MIAFKEIAKIFSNITILVSSRKPDKRALTQLKNMIRLSDDIHKFRKELFNAPELFIKKINNADLLTKKWKMISSDLIICNMEDTKNPATNYFENTLKVLSKKRQQEIRKFLINSNNFDENYEFHENEDPYDLYNYFLCIVCGTKIKNAEISLKDKFSFKKLNGFINGKSDKIKSIFKILTIIN